MSVPFKRSLRLPKAPVKGPLGCPKPVLKEPYRVVAKSPATPTELCSPTTKEYKVRLFGPLSMAPVDYIS